MPTDINQLQNSTFRQHCLIGFDNRRGLAFVRVPGLVDQVRADCLNVSTSQSIIETAHAFRQISAVQDDVIKEFLVGRGEPAQVWEHATPKDVTATADSVVKNLTLRGLFERGPRDRWLQERGVDNLRRLRHGPSAEL